LEDKKTMRLSEITLEAGKDIFIEKPQSDALAVIATDVQLVEFIVLYGDQRVKPDSRDRRTFIVPAFDRSRSN
jgi:hypothetical protein